MEWLSKCLHLRQVADWYRVSMAQINSFISRSIFEAISLYDRLQEAYPDYPWDEHKLKHGFRLKKALKECLLSLYKRYFHIRVILDRKLVLKLFVELKENFICTKTMLSFDGNPIELDVYLPQEKLAFEYQGEQHYRYIPGMGRPWMHQRLIDNEKKNICNQIGITLIEVPY